MASGVGDVPALNCSGPVIPAQSFKNYSWAGSEAFPAHN